MMKIGATRSTWLTERECEAATSKRKDGCPVQRRKAKAKIEYKIHTRYIQDNPRRMYLLSRSQSSNQHNTSNVTAPLQLLWCPWAITRE